MLILALTALLAFAGAAPFAACPDGIARQRDHRTVFATGENCCCGHQGQCPACGGHVSGTRSGHSPLSPHLCGLDSSPAAVAVLRVGTAQDGQASPHALTPSAVGIDSTPKSSRVREDSIPHVCVLLPAATSPRSPPIA